MTITDYGELKLKHCLFKRPIFGFSDADSEVQKECYTQVVSSWFIFVKENRDAAIPVD